jgi:hypothetical protein
MIKLRNSIFNYGSHASMIPLPLPCMCSLAAEDPPLVTRDGAALEVLVSADPNREHKILHELALFSDYL